MVDSSAPTQGKEVVVVGGGIIGTCTAHALREAGFRVAVLEARENVALETSYANAGRFCPTLVASYPLSKPEILQEFMSLRGLWRMFWGSSKQDAIIVEATKIKPTGSLPSSVEPTQDLLQWGAIFLRNCTTARHDCNNKIFRKLAHLCQDATAALIEQFPGKGSSIDLRADNVWVYGSGESVDKAVTLMQKSSGSGFNRWTELSCEECALAYPFLNTYFSKMKKEELKPGCVLAHDDYTADAQKFTNQVKLLCEKGPNPVRFWFGQRLQSVIQTPAGRVQLIVTQGDGAYSTTMEVDHVVLCCGPSTNKTLASLGMPALPILGLRGASVDLYGVKNAPKASIADYVSGPLNFQVTPLGNGAVRLIGFSDFVKDGAEPASPEQLQRYETALIARSRSIFPEMTWTSKRQAWSGVRPTTPDSLPIIGRLPGTVENIWINTGHGPVGWTMAAGSARILAHQIALTESESPQIHRDLRRYGLDNASAFSPDRFSQWNLTFTKSS